MSIITKLILIVLLLPAPLFAQQAVKPVGSNQAQLLPNPFASADNIAAQTSTAIHGLMFGWDSGGSNWDRILVTSGAMNVSVQNSTLAVTQSGTWTVQPGNTANTTPWKVDGSGVTQPVSGTITANAGTNLNTSLLALDSTLTGGTQKAIIRGGAKGATTAVDVTSTAEGADHQSVDVQIYHGGTAKDPTAIRALTSADTVTVVQGTGTNLHTVVDSGSLTVTQGTGTNLHMVCDSGCGGAATFSDNSAFTFSTTAVNLMAGVVDDTATNTVTENSGGHVRMSTNAILYSNPTDNTGSQIFKAPAALGDAETNPTTGGVAVYVKCFNGTTWDRCRGTTIDADDNTVATAQSSSLVINENYLSGASTWVRQLSAANALNSTGDGLSASQIIGQFDDTSPTSITENQFGNLRMSANRNLYGTIRDAAGNERGANVNSSNQLSVSVDNTGTIQVVPGTTNGASTCVLQSAATTNATNCKNAAGLLYGGHIVNTTATIYYLRLYNLSASPTCSSSTGFIRTIPIPASTSGAGIGWQTLIGETYGTGVGFCLTGGGSSTDNTNAATGVYITLFYK